ncbi:MAG: hypothetical protein JJE51_04660 [Thermoanaerobaculia bacterium]|nr:hypothetical protein [Thermoanaerobaculia bacterium]
MRLLLALLIAMPLAAQPSRIASDFEIAQMKDQLARSRDFVSQLSARLNLGDAYATRNEPSTARQEYAEASRIASAERIAARRIGDLTRYSTATSYAALAQAKLGRAESAFTLLEEATRYSADSAKSWNLYSSAMTLLRQPAKASSAARNAVAIATREVEATPSVANRLDLTIYQYSLASSLGDTAEAERLLRAATTSLRLRAFDDVRREAGRAESFEIYSTARGDSAAYLSILNRAGLRLASLLETRGEIARARDEYERVLETRTDDATALAALARLSDGDERERRFAEAFDANPFSMALVRDYQKYVAQTPPAVDGDSTGARVRGAIAQMEHGESRAARTTLDALIAEFPNNETLRTLRREAEGSAGVPEFLSGAADVIPTSASQRDLGDLLQLLAGDKLTSQQRTRLDELQFSGTAVFTTSVAGENQTTLESGTIEGVRFRFSEPTMFRGVFAASTPLRLAYRVLGATEVNGADALLLEPLGVEVSR